MYIRFNITSGNRYIILIKLYLVLELNSKNKYLLNTKNSSIFNRIHKERERG